MFKITYDFIKPYIPDIELVKARSIINLVVEDELNESKTFKGVDGKKYRINWDNSVNEYTNCYAFAMGWEYAINGMFGYIPGMFSGRLPEKCADFKDCIIGDLKALGRKVYDFIEGKDIPKELPNCDDNSYWIKAMVISDNNLASFHIARKDEESGRWLHKVGFKEPTILMRNIELTPDYSKIYNHVYFRPRDGFKPTEKDIINFATMFRISYQEITKSVVETDDNASYFDYAPVFYRVDTLTEFYPLWAMRIEKPSSI